jgi:hypothetical protein
MGTGHHGVMYSKLENGKRTRSWKIASSQGCYITFLSECGNAFYPKPVMKHKEYTAKMPPAPVCKEVEVNITSEPKEITLPEAGQKHITKKTYIYYVERCGGCGSCFTGCEDDARGKEGKEYRSKPLCIKTEDIVEPVAVTYRVTTTGTARATVCCDSTTPSTVRADVVDVSIEKESAYTGGKPEVKKEYIEVSKHEYRQHMRCNEGCGESYNRGCGEGRGGCGGERYRERPNCNQCGERYYHGGCRECK